MKKYQLSSAAISDLEEISDYTYNEWGQQAQDKYMDGFEEVFMKISSGVITKRLFSKKYPKLFSAKSGRHIVFYIDDGPNGNPTIIAILHEKMDIANRLEQRMEKFRKAIN